jgi:hypothetical protein
MTDDTSLVPGVEDEQILDRFWESTVQSRYGVMDTT